MDIAVSTAVSADKITVGLAGITFAGSAGLTAANSAGVTAATLSDPYLRERHFRK